MKYFQRTKSLLAGLLSSALLLSLAACTNDHSQSELTSQPPAMPSQQSEQQEVYLDFMGHEFTEAVDSVSCIHPIFTLMALRLAPEKVKSVDMVFTKQYLSENSKKDLLRGMGLDKIQALPVTNTFFQGVDPEQILELNPDVVVTLSKDPNAEELSAQTGKPVFVVSKNTLEDYATSMRMMGSLLNAEETAEEMATFWEQSIKTVADSGSDIPEDQRAKIYDCGNGGILSVPGKDTIMSSIIEIAGGHNLGDEISTEDNATNESIQVDMEQVLAWDPDIIIANNQTEYQEIMESPEWNQLNAVKNGRVYCQLKYAYMDGLTAIPGLVWCNMLLTDTLDSARDSYYKQAQAYYKLFYNCDVTEEELDILN